MGIVLGDPLNHGLLLLFRHAAGFHLIQRYQHHIALHIAAHAVDRFTLLRQRQGKCQLAQRILAGTRKRLRRAKAQASRLHRFIAFAVFQRRQQLVGLQFRLLFRFIVLNDIANLCLHFGQRLHRLGFVFANAQNKSAIAVNGNDIGVAARRAVLTHQTAVENSVSDRFKVQLFRQVIAAKPAGFYHLQSGDLRRARQRLIIVAGRIAHLLLQRVVSIQRFFLLHFRRNVITHVSQRLHLRRLDVVQTSHQEANRGFDHARQLAFLFQPGIFQLRHRRGLFHPPHIAAVAGRDNIGRFFFRQRGEVRSFLQLGQYRFRIGFSFGLNHAVAVALRLSELILVLVVP